MKLKSFLINCLFIFSLISCNSHRYNLTWNSLGATTDRFITVAFWDNSNLEEYEYKLIQNKTKYINVPNSAEFTREETPVDIKLVIYPQPNKLPKGGDLELFVFYPEVKQINENEFRMEKQKGVEAYFVKFSKNGKRYYVISKDEIISIQKEISLNSINNIQQLLDLVKTEDITYFDESGTNNYHGSELVWGGYIVKTKINGQYLWLNASMPIP